MVADLLNRSQAKSVIDEEEGHFSDVKSIDVAPSKLTRTLSAFANADGGELYVGIDEDLATGARTWRGFSKCRRINIKRSGQSTKSGHIPFERSGTLSHSWSTPAASIGASLQP